MKRYLLDSNTLSAFVGRREGVYERAIALSRTGAVMGTTVAVLAETIAGIHRSASRERNLDAFNQKMKHFKIWTFDSPAARMFGELKDQLRMAGIIMQPMDLITASIARILGKTTIVTTDSDFARVPGLNVENWLV